MKKTKDELATRLALVCTNIPSIGGTVIHMINLYKYLNHEKSRVYIVFCSKIDDELRHFLIKEGVRQEDFILLSRFKKWLIIPLILELRRFFLNNKIDIVHTFQMQSDILGAFAARLAGIRFMFSMHHSKIIEEHISIIKKLFYRIGNKIFKNSFLKTMVISNGLKQELITGKFRTKDDIEIIHPGYDILGRYKAYKPDFNKLKNGCPVIGAVGRLSWEKGQSRFISAIPFVSERIPGAKFLIVGKGDQQELLMRQAIRLNLESKITFTGWVEDLFLYLETIDIVVVPSLREGFGFVILESFMLSKPVVASDVEGIRDIIDDGKNGLLVDTSNPHIFADKILYLCDNPEKAILMGKNAHEKLTSKFTIEGEISKLKQLYLNCIEQNKYGLTRK